MQETGKGIFSAEEVTAELDAKLRPRLHIRTVDITGSTNDDLKALAADGAPDGEVLIAGAQTAGKGRLGRSFWSPGHAGLYMSVLLRPVIPAGEALAITTAAAAAAAIAIDELSGRRSGIKWVNDIYIDGRKVCGILTESAVSQSGGLSWAVMGIGVNASDIGFPEDLQGKAGAAGIAPELIPQLAARILTHFFTYCDRLPEKVYMDEYRSRSVLTGRVIEYEMNGELHSGKVEGIDDDARLIVRNENGVIPLLSGEVNIKTKI